MLERAIDFFKDREEKNVILTKSFELIFNLADI